jgi:5-methylcytosine-specific restriction endonuclease McrA
MAAPKGNHNAQGVVKSPKEMRELDDTRLYTKNGKELRLSRAVNSIRKCGYRRGIEWGLNNLQAARMLLAECYYCGHVPDIDNQDYNPYNGIDRLDSSEGYVPGNVVTACRRCNVAKHILSHTQFLTLVKAIANKHGL